MNTRNIAPSFCSLTLLTMLLATSRVDAQFAIEWFTIDGGGGFSVGGTYSLMGTVGQADAAFSSGGGYTLHGGFWAGAPAEIAPALRILRGGTNVTLAWPNASAGFELQESSSLTAPDWTNVTTTPAIVGDEKQVNQPVAPVARFYRLRKL